MPERRERCECRRLFSVAYATEPGEARELTPGPCLGSGSINYVFLGRTAVETLQYRPLAERRERDECWGRRKAFVVVCEAEPNEPRELVAVDPSPLQLVNYASVARRAAHSSDRGYRTQRVGRSGGDT